MFSEGIVKVNWTFYECIMNVELVLSFTKIAVGKQFNLVAISANSRPKAVPAVPQSSSPTIRCTLQQ